MRARLDDLAARAVGRTLPESLHGPVMSAVRSLLWRGAAVQCPCCGGRWVSFLPYWNRDNCRCPRCDSHERHRALWLYLRDRDLSGDLLHLAPEEAIARHLRGRPEIRYVSADLSSPQAMLHFDVQDIPFRDATFDRVLCGHVLTEVPDDRRAMREMRRVLRDTGWAVIMAAVQPGLERTDEDPAVTEPEARRARFLEPLNVRLYGADFADRLREAGFRVEVVPFVRGMAPEQIRRFGLLEADDLYVCTPA